MSALHLGSIQSKLNDRMSTFPQQTGRLPFNPMSGQLPSSSSSQDNAHALTSLYNAHNQQFASAITSFASFLPPPIPGLLPPLPPLSLPADLPHTDPSSHPAIKPPSFFPPLNSSPQNLPYNSNSTPHNPYWSRFPLPSSVGTANFPNLPCPHPGFPFLPNLVPPLAPPPTTSALQSPRKYNKASNSLLPNFPTSSDCLSAFKYMQDFSAFSQTGNRQTLKPANNSNGSSSFAKPSSAVLHPDINSTDNATKRFGPNANNCSKEHKNILIRKRDALVPTSPTVPLVNGGFPYVPGLPPYPMPPIIQELSDSDHVPCKKMKPCSSSGWPMSPYLMFMQGTPIQLNDGSVKRIEQLKLEDFVKSAEAIAGDLSEPTKQFDKMSKDKANRLEVCVVKKITATCPSSQRCQIDFTVGKLFKKTSLEVSDNQPFFVSQLGWSAVCPDRALQRFSLKCRRLQEGDVCLSLVPLSDAKRRKEHQPSTNCSDKATSCLLMVTTEELSRFSHMSTTLSKTSSATFDKDEQFPINH